MNILTWNVWYKESPQNILTLLRQQAWDVCCLQEITIGYHSEPYCDVATYLAEALGVHHHFVMAQAREHGNKVQGNLILSKTPFTNATSHFVQDYNTKDDHTFADEGRVIAEITLENGMRLLTTHLSYTHQFAETEKKTNEANKLLAYLKTMDSPFVVTGDFNVTPDSHLIDELTKQYRILCPAWNEPTWTTKPFSYMGFDVDALAYRLDYLFGSRDINMLSSHIIQTDYSDHLPIITKISSPMG